ncbi:MAG: UDP-N-acetylglucosamine 1-carboxyvinyltransferase, partial [Bacteroidales bacterium]|nr:UDP-N-acetylglucosamine 1-carboxyvinyltransferase [Bacteroidales bacterium]
MSAFIVEGGHRLQGSITPQGAKNEALQLLCALLLTEEEVLINNLPDILDVNNLISLLGDLGVSVSRRAKGSYAFQAKDINLDILHSDEFLAKTSSLRGSVMLLGPLLARFGFAMIAKPGGDKIG